MCQSVYCMFLMFRYVYHMGIDIINKKDVDMWQDAVFLKSMDSSYPAHCI